MTLHRRLIAVVVAALLACAALIVQRASSSEAATTYQFTVTGHDLQSLDARISPQLVPGSAGGVTGTIEDGKQPQNAQAFFEVGLDLPAGAKVTSVAITM